MLYRMSGLALLIGLPPQVLGLVIHPPGEEVEHVLWASYGPSHMLLVVSWLFILLGLPGLYAYQAGRAGRMGVVSFALLVVLVAYHVYLTLYEAFVTPLLADEAATQGLIGPGGELAHGVEAVSMIFMPFIVAFPLFGIATLRAGVYPRWSAWLQIAAVPVWILNTIALSLLPSGIEDALLAPLHLGGTTPFYTVLVLGYAAAGYALRTAFSPERVVVDRASLPRAAA
jgi:hypothetical protein